MVKGTNFIQLNQETVKLYVEEALNRRLGAGIDVKVTTATNLDQVPIGLLEFAFVPRSA